MRRLVILFLMILLSRGAWADQRVLNVGIFNNDPILFVDSAGRAHGLAIDVLTAIAAREGWKLRYHFAPWKQLLAKLKKGEIDLLPGIAYSKERAKLYRFSNETLVSNWGVVYTRSRAPMTTLLDLSGKRIAVVGGAIHTRAISELLRRFNVRAKLIHVGSYLEVFQAVEDGKADAGVVNRIFSVRHATQFHLLPTPIIFNPIEVRYAAPKSANPAIMGALDRELKQLKEDGNSIYYRALGRWLGAPSESTIPTWVPWVLLGGGGVLGIVLWANIWLRRQVRARTAELAASEERFNLAVKGSSDGLWDWTVGTGNVYFSHRFKELLGYGDDEFPNRIESFESHLHPDDHESVMASILVHLKERKHYDVELRLRTRDDRYRWFRARGQAVWDSEGLAVRMAGSITDITQRKQSEEALRESESRFRDVAHAAGEFIWEVDDQWRYTYVSGRLQSILGFEQAELLGRRPVDFSPQDDGGELDAWFRGLSAEALSFRDIEYVSVTRDGEQIWLEISGVPIRDENGLIVGYRGTGSDVTERKRAEHEIERLATRDPLTGLPNRALLNDRLAHAIADAQRNRTQVGFLFIDLDRFKNINDSLGHHVGDELLQQVGKRLESCIRGGDTVARLGGDEFVVLLEDLHRARDAAPIAQNILRTVNQPYHVDGNVLNTSSSIGISIYPDDGNDIQILLRNADTAMYHAKALGRNDYQFFSPDMNVRAVQRLELETALRRAVDQGEFVLHYQPQFDISTGEVVGAEALLRWHHPQWGMVSPADFIAVAEETGLIIPIGECVLYTACEQAARWQAFAGRPLQMAVNLSAQQVRPELIKTVSDALDSAGLAARHLTLEITETLMMHNIEDNIRLLDDLRNLGTRIAIDDFGTGYSSLSYLKRFPVHELKIDQSFVHDLGAGSENLAIVRAVIAMASSLNLCVVAEGVETEEQRAVLKTMGCRLHQGFLYGRPAAASHFSDNILRAVS